MFKQSFKIHLGWHFFQHTTPFSSAYTLNKGFLIWFPVLKGDSKESGLLWVVFFFFSSSWTYSSIFQSISSNLLIFFEASTVDHMKIIPQLSGKRSYWSMYLHAKSIHTQKFPSKAASGHILPELGLPLCANEVNISKMLKYFPQNNLQA